VRGVWLVLLGCLIGGSAVGAFVYVTDSEDSEHATPVSSPTEVETPETEPSVTVTPTEQPSLPSTPASPDRLGDSDAVRLDGLGPLAIGMTVEEMEAAVGKKLRIFSDFGPSCRYSQFDDGTPGLHLMLSHRKLVRIDVSTYSTADGNFENSAIRTDLGIGIGDPIEEAERVYADHLEREPHPYLGDRGSYLVYDSDPDDGLLLILEADRKKITSFRAGYDQQVRYIEGCA
jgi:hypothetical protein